eukprot:gene59905-81961_t
MSATIQFGFYNPPFGFFFARLVPGTASTYAPAFIDPNLAGELALVATTAVMLTGWSWLFVGDRGRSNLRWLTPIPPLAMVTLHAAHPLLGGVTLAASALTLAVALRRTSRTPKLVGWAISAIGLAPIFSSYGPLAAAAGSLQRAGAPELIGLLAACWQMGCAALIVVATLRSHSGEAGSAAQKIPWDDARPYVLAGASSVRLPRGSWVLLLDFLDQRFPDVGRTVWRARLAEGKVSDA